MTRLFDDSHISLGPSALVLREFALREEPELLAALDAVTAAARFRHMVTPGGFRMSVGMTNCGALGWVSDRKGYRYDPADPETGLPWPPLPPSWLRLAARAAAETGFPDFVPDACLVNRYVPGAKLTLHQDRNERDFAHPIVSVSLGLPAVFQFGGLERSAKVRRVRLEHGDVVVWGGESRLFYHGVLPLADGTHPLLGPCRINLTFRRAG
ncbi:MAG TPA: DNA oxidative demethylase AlkB [Bryobacteraceae bacterium]|nr:DNA oxidative demethylase AlkB [Bryobacteraceae bacterium]